MFNNIGKKIKGVAALFCFIGIFASLILGALTITGDNTNLIITGIMIMVAGSFLSWLASLVFYGFGQLIDDADIIADAISEGQDLAGNTVPAAGQAARTYAAPAAGQAARTDATPGQAARTDAAPAGDAASQAQDPRDFERVERVCSRCGHKFTVVRKILVPGGQVFCPGCGNCETIR